jgi:iron only hydrogenase large subunit-like protein
LDSSSSAHGGSGGDSGGGAPDPKIPHKWTRPLATVALNQDEDRTVPTLASGEESRVIPVVHSSNATTTSNLEGVQKRVPLLTSSCPGWICFVEKTHPEAIPYLSTAKSPQQVMGSLIKSCAVLSSNASETTSPQVEPLDSAASTPLAAAAAAVPAVRSKGGVYHLTIMPCPDKKLEASRKDFEAKLDGGDSGSGSGSADVDCVLTTNELLSWLDETDANTNTDAVAPAAAASTHTGK